MRKRRAERRPLSPDPKFNDILVSRFINSIMLHGKKTTARRILYSAMEDIEKRTGQNGYEVFREKYPKLCDFIWKYAKQKNFGVQFLDDDGNVTEEYTLYTNNLEIADYDEGLIDCDMVVALSESYAEQFIDQFDDFDSAGELLLRGLKYVPKIVKGLVDGDLRFSEVD